jgi:hypothetical protein
VAEGEKNEPEGASAEEKARKEAEEAAERLREIKVADLVVQAVTGLVSLGFVRLAGDQRDLAQARLAIDSLRALEPVVREQMSAEIAGELQRAVASLQLAFAESVEAAKAPDTATAPTEPESGDSPSAEPDSVE